MAKKPTQEAKKKEESRRFAARIYLTLKNVGFSPIKTRDQEIHFIDRVGEIDSIYVYKNILIIAEDTCSNSENVKDHLRKKAEFWGHIKSNKKKFIEYLQGNVSEFNKITENIYSANEYHICFLYASRYPIDSSYKNRYNNITILEYKDLRYFEALSKTIHHSARYELLKFLGISLQDTQISSTVSEGKKYECFVLPEAPSGFPDDHKLVAFYADPQSLIELAYVLRKDSWRNDDGLYQRMLIKRKIASMREYLALQERVYVNNVIVSLPSNARFIDKITKKPIDPNNITQVRHLLIDLPIEYDTIGLIDGQHRVFSYHEGCDKHEDVIKNKRKKQQLLVTGIIFPESMSQDERTKFEARMFLEINDRQSRTRGDLKQAIQVIVDPFNSTSVAKAVVSRMAEDGPLAGLLENHYFGEGKIKTTSVVSYGLRHIVPFRGTGKKNIPKHSIFHLWNSLKRDVLNTKDDYGAWKEYVTFCAESMNAFFQGFKIVMSKKHLWTTDIKSSRVLTITSINGLIYCMRLLIAEGKTGDMEYYEKCFEKIKVDFSPANFKYRSSHWKTLGIQIYNECFNLSPSPLLTET